MGKLSAFPIGGSGLSNSEFWLYAFLGGLLGSFSKDVYDVLKKYVKQIRKIKGAMKRA